MTEDTGAPVNSSLDIALHLLNMLPTLLVKITFNSPAPILTSFMPEVYASWPWLSLSSLDLMHTLPPQSDQMAMDVLKDEIICHIEATATKAAVQIPTSIPPTLPVHVNLDGQEDELCAGDSSVGKPSWVVSTLSCTDRHSPAQLPSPHCHLHCARTSSSSSSISASRSRSHTESSSSGSSWSSQLGSGSWPSSHVCSDASGPAVSAHSCSTSPEDIQVVKDDCDIIEEEAEDVASEVEGNLLQGALSLPDFLATDNNNTQKAVAHEVTWKSYTQYGAWRDEQIHQGRDDIALRDKTAHDYAEVGKVSKASDHLGPPISYMQACKPFRPWLQPPIHWGYAGSIMQILPVQCQLLLPIPQLPSISLST